MQTSIIKKLLLKYLPLLIVMAVALTGSRMIKDLDPKVVDSRTEINEIPLQTEQLEPQLLNVNETENECFGPLIYTSLPPKCRTLDGDFIQIDEVHPYIIVPKNK